jgi:tetratricopeptide (TPR) repeat protein
LTRLSNTDLSSFDLRDAESLVFTARKALLDDPRLADLLDPDEVAMALIVLRSMLYASPAWKRGSGQEITLGARLVGKRLVKFLKLCLMLGAKELLVSTFRERIKGRNKIGGLLFNPNSLVQALAEARQWTMIIHLFSPPAFPIAFTTPEILQPLLQAHLATRQPHAVPRLFERFVALKLAPTADAYANLTQAYLDLGNIEAAQQALRTAKANGEFDEQLQQMALLRGHRALGHDEDLERRVLADLHKLDMQPQAAVLNALVRLRLDRNDLLGAEDLLKHFDLEPFQMGIAGKHGTIPPTEHTVQFTFMVFARRCDLVRLRQTWEYLNTSRSASGLLRSTNTFRDNILAILVRTLNRAGKVEEAYAVLRSAVDGTEGPWPIPQGVKPGHRALNALLAGLAHGQGMGGIKKAFDLFSASGLKPDQTTLEHILDFVHKHTNSKPADLAIFVSSFLKQNPHLRPTVPLVDSIMASAISNAVRRSQHKDVTVGSGQTSGIVAGLRTVDPFKRSMRPLIQSLRDRNAQSTSNSLANRLRFDAQALASAGDLPSARVVWSALLARGYKPDNRHLLALLQGYADAGDMVQAEEILALAGAVGVQISKAMYMALIVGWGQVGKARKAEEAYGALCRSPRGADTPAICAMIQAAYRCGDFDRAARYTRTDLLHQASDGSSTPGMPRKLDTQSATVAVTALRSVNAYDEAFAIIRTTGPALSPLLRRLVRNMRNWLQKQGRERDLRTIDQILRADDEARPIGERRAPSAKGVRRRLKAIVSKGRSIRGRGNRKMMGRLLREAEGTGRAEVAERTESEVKAMAD